MEFSQRQTATIIAGLLLAAAVTQSLYTALYMAEVEVPRQLLWGFEALVFVLLAAFAGSALAQAKGLTLGFSAIAFSGALNVVQVGVGLTMFKPFFTVAAALPALEPASEGVFAFSFMVYNAAKILLGLAAVVFGMARVRAGAKLLGGLAVAAGAVAMVANTLVMAGGLDGIVPSPVAGGSGVVATVLLALCLLGTSRED